MIVCCTVLGAVLHLRVDALAPLPAEAACGNHECDDYSPDQDASDDAKVDCTLFLSVALWACLFSELWWDWQVVLFLLEIVWCVLSWG